MNYFIVTGSVRISRYMSDNDTVEKFTHLVQATDYNNARYKVENHYSEKGGMYDTSYRAFDLEVHETIE